MGETDKILDEMFGKTLRATPPMAPKPKPVVEKPVKLHPPKPVRKIEDDFFYELASSTEFKRFIYKVLYGKVHRTEKQHGNLDEMVKEGLEVISELGDTIRGSKAAYREVMKELKQKLASKKIDN